VETLKRNEIFILLMLFSLLSAFLVTAFILMNETGESEMVPKFEDHILQKGLNGPLYVSTIDLDQDTDADILATIFHENKVVWYENKGNKSFHEHVIDNDCKQATCIHGTDLDNDGDIDIIASSSVEGIFYYKNLGTPILNGLHLMNP